VSYREKHPESLTRKHGLQIHLNMIKPRENMRRIIFLSLYIDFINWNGMERIVIQVDDSAGKMYRMLSSEKQQQISQAVNLLLKKASNDATATDYRKLLDEFGSKAMANGLTEEILAELLKRDD